MDKVGLIYFGLRRLQNDIFSFETKNRSKIRFLRTGACISVKRSPQNNFHSRTLIVPLVDLGA